MFFAEKSNHANDPDLIDKYWNQNAEIVFLMLLLEHEDNQAKLAKSLIMK